MSDDAPGTTPLRLGEDFPPVPTEAWEDAIRADLKGADYDKKLAWRLEEGLTVKPYYRAEDLVGLEGRLASPPGEFPYVRGTGAAWHIAEALELPAGAIRADKWHDGGATAVQEAAWAVAAGVDRLAARTGSLDDAARAIAFVFAVGSTYFLEIAKLRAARLLWARAVSAFGTADPGATRMHVLVRTARVNKSLYDPYTNLLRATTEAMSAAIGGCEQLAVEPFGFEPHLAVNVQRILVEEAHLDAVLDPAGGAYYIEALTDALAREAWRLFQEIEAAGGFARAEDAGTIAASLAQARAAREKAVSSRRRTLVGVNNYPDLAEKAPTVTDVPAEARTGWRLASPFEAIRARTERHARETGRTPRVLLLVRGDVKMRGARANFCLNFFGCAGFDVVQSDSYQGTPADLVVLCSSDAEYLGIAEEVCPTAGVPVLVAGNPKDQIEALARAGVQGFVHIGSDAVQTLTEWQGRLGIA